MPHKQDFVKKYNFSCDERRTMKRRIAGAFRAEDGLIHLGYRDDDWEKQLVRVLGKSVQPVLSKRRCKAHYALVKQVVADLRASREVTFTGSGAKMSPKCMEQQAGISRKLRDRARQGQGAKQPQSKRRPVRRKKWHQHAA